MKLKVFTYFCTKLYNFYKNELVKLKKLITIQQQTVENINSSMTEVKNNVAQNTNNISSVSEKVNELKTKADNGDFNTINNTNVSGDILNINNVKQHVFKNIKAGEAIEIPNEGIGADFIVQCYEQIDTSDVITVKTIEVNTSNKDLFEYDERYVTIDDTGAHPKNEIDIPMELKEIRNGMKVCVSKETFPVELLESINNIYDYSITEKVSDNE